MGHVLTQQGEPTICPHKPILHDSELNVNKASYFSGKEQCTFWHINVCFGVFFRYCICIQKCLTFKTCFTHLFWHIQQGIWRGFVVVFLFVVYSHFRRIGKCSQNTSFVILEQDTIAYYYMRRCTLTKAEPSTAPIICTGR